MLKIRPEQMEAFVLARTEDFLAQLCGKLRVEMPDLCQPVDLEEVVRQGYKKARQYGIESEATVDRFIRIQLALGVDFDRVSPASTCRTPTPAVSTASSGGRTARMTPSRPRRKRSPSCIRRPLVASRTPARA